MTSSRKKIKLILGSDGRNPGNEGAAEIWRDLLDDCGQEVKECESSADSIPTESNLRGQDRYFCAGFEAV